MTTTNQFEPTASVLCIEGEMSIYQAADLKQSLLAALEQTEVLELNLAAVTELDTAGVQILMLLKTQALATQRQLNLVAHSPAVIDVFDLLNLAAYFGDPLLIAPTFATRRV